MLLLLPLLLAVATGAVVPLAAASRVWVAAAEVLEGGELLFYRDIVLDDFELTGVRDNVLLYAG